MREVRKSIYIIVDIVHAIYVKAERLVNRPRRAAQMRAHIQYMHVNLRLPGRLRRVARHRDRRRLQRNFYFFFQNREVPKKAESSTDLLLLRSRYVEVLKMFFYIRS